jgi:membrane fusion protein
MGDAMRLVPLSHGAFALFLVLIIATAIAYGASAGYSRKETVQGVVTPSGGVIRVAAPRAGTITEVLAREGEIVREDQVLVRVVSEETNASGLGSDTAILDALKQQQSIIEEQIRNESDHARSERQRLEAQLLGLGGEIEQLENQRALQAERAKNAHAYYQRAIPLRDQNIIAAPEFQNRRQAALNEEQSLASFDERLSSKRNDLKQAQLGLERQPMESADRIANLKRNLADVVQRAAEIEGRRRYIVRAPLAGRVSSVVAAVGRRVDTRMPMLSIVPTDSRFEAELYVPARAIGFVARGQTVRLLYDAFPFQSFGSYRGTVESVATTMLQPSDLPEPVLALREPAYRVKVALARQTVDAFGSEVALQPDMTLRADIILERRSLLEWLLEPLLSARHRMS